MRIPKFIDGYERGSIMLMVLFLFLLVSFLGVSAVELGVMEVKSSHYDFAAGQAQQAVDAGVDWGLERIYAELNLPVNLITATLPSQLNCSNQVMGLNVADKTCAVSIGEVTNITNQSNDPGSCTYEFTSSGIFESACKRVTVKATYYFTGGYEYLNTDGSISFMPREYQNRGDIIYYQASI